MDKATKAKYRADLFRHLDGIVTAPTAYVLLTSGILPFIVEKKNCTLSQLASQFKANEGYLNVALRVLASQGWLKYGQEKGEIVVSVNARTKIAILFIPLYEKVVKLIEISGEYHPRRFEEEPFSALDSLFTSHVAEFGLDKPSDVLHAEVLDQVLKHVEGYIVGPSTVALGMGGMFHKYFMQASFRADEFHNNGKSFDRLLDIFSHLGWFQKQDETYRFTEKGLFFARRASAYGVTVSYIPTFRKLEELLFGDPTIFWRIPEDSPEIHVDRAMNVWGSGGAHSSYFKKIDEIIIGIFNQPLEDQPKGIVDMGCGN